MKTAIKPLAELREYAAGFSVRCRASGWFAALFHVGVISDIIEDGVKAQEKIERDAYTAAIHDEEAIAKLNAAIADGLDASDLPTIREAMNLISRSANQDRSISQQAQL